MGHCWGPVAQGCCCLLAVALVVGSAPVAAHTDHGPLLQSLVERTAVQGKVGSAQELLATLNASAGSNTSQMITITDDIHLLPADLEPFQHHLPLDGGSRTLVLCGNPRRGRQVVLDWGGAVNVMDHPAGHSFITYNLMVSSAFWPTYTGEPGHLMAFWNTNLKTVSPDCDAISTAFRLRSLQLMAGRNDTIRLLDNTTIFVGQQLNGTFAMRNTTTGDQVGNVRWSWDNTTLQCSKPANTNTVAAASSAAAHLAATQSASTGIAGSAEELLLLLSTPSVLRIILGIHIYLGAASWQSFALPIVLASRSVSLGSNDDQLRILDLGGNPSLLYISANSSLHFARVHIQGIAPASQVLSSRATSMAGSPLWPTVDCASDSKLGLQDTAVDAIVTPCSRNATLLSVSMLQKEPDLGKDGVQVASDTSYAILSRFTRQEPITDVLSGQEVGSTLVTYDRVVIRCQEDPAISLAAELHTMGGLAGTGNITGAAATPNSGGGTPAWVLAIAASVAACTVLAGIVAATLVWRRRRAGLRAEQPAASATASGGAKPSELAPFTPRGARLDQMESADPSTSTDQLGAAVSTALSNPSTLTNDNRRSSSDTERRQSQSQEADGGGWVQDALWWSRFGVIEGLEVGELLGRGAYGKVYKGRWNGAIVAVKVVEHRVAAGEPDAISREPLLCMSVSHPNCITTYKLSIIRLLRGDDLLESEQASEEELAAVRTSPTTDASADTARGSDGGSKAEPRRVLSLMSGAEAVEVADPYGPLQPGLYETWIVTEFCERGNLADALAEKRLALPDGRPNMASVCLCLLDIASGIQYLHSLGIIHGDLKPANVLLKSLRNTRGFTCKLADFGLSRMLDGRATHVETGSCGTPTHAAPELLHEGRLSPAVDTFAFGILAWELVAGEEAWRRQHPMQIILQVTQQGARPPALPHCPPPLAALMARCWADEPAGRPAFTELLTQLQEQLLALRRAQQRREQQAQPGRPSAASAAGTLTTQPSAALLLPAQSGELAAEPPES